MTPLAIKSVVAARADWNEVKEVLNAMIDDEVVVWTDDQTKLFIPNVSKRSDQ
jgi:hypothetical protein